MAAGHCLRSVGVQVVDVAEHLLGGGDVGHVEGHHGGVDVGDLAQRLDQPVGVLAVEEHRPAAPVGPGRDEHAHLGLAVCRGPVGQLQGGTGEAPVGHFDDLEGQTGRPKLGPAAA